jgi:peroxiredoxin
VTSEDSTVPDVPDVPDPIPEHDGRPGWGQSQVRSLHADLPLVLFFVGDLTDPVSTTMIASFEDRLDAFEQRGMAVQGVVAAPADEVDRYVANHGLRMRLVSDERGDACRMLGCTPRTSEGTTVVLFELVARAASIEGLAPYAQADAALALVAGDVADDGSSAWLHDA